MVPVVVSIVILLQVFYSEVHAQTLLLTGMKAVVQVPAIVAVSIVVGAAGTRAITAALLDAVILVEFLVS